MRKNRIGYAEARRRARPVFRAARTPVLDRKTASARELGQPSKAASNAYRRWKRSPDPTADGTKARAFADNGEHPDRSNPRSAEFSCDPPAGQRYRAPRAIRPAP